MGFFNKAKDKIKSAYESGAKFSHEINEIREKNQADKIKILKQKNEIARQQASIAHQKALSNKFKQQSGGGLWGGSGSGSGGFNALIAPSPGGHKTANNSLYGNNFNPGGF
jgi:FtsZ-binding cell division protein ZapB